MQNPNENIQIIETGDGSHTLYHLTLDEHYHSVHGSVQESKHVFIEMGLRYFKGQKAEINLLEVGFGTGLNCLLSALSHSDLNINYCGIEPFPVQEELLLQLNYTNGMTQQNKELFMRIFSCQWEKEIVIHPGFKLTKRKVKLQDFSDKMGFDLVYFDAFAPRPQPDMWELEVFKKCYNLMTHNGILVTYCAKGQVRRNMQAAGFEVERLAGPPGKREMLRAKKT